ncbi:hypothetical protein BCR44DRAFT_1270021 [Catenaria anguillulae PL171]|uniref:Glutathione S-transferase n=1 Tax=Catenaria anguillulae PL171 TaxID=765915 RepID=A0A1Y2HZT3_9FUNG|nr:hypothetical protein BCR44DRAFT_1270021 [Catenaria anguillulae PL171]
MEQHPPPMYTVHYFPIAGRAELARMILEIAGYPIDWDAEKSTTPFGQLPLLHFTDPATSQPVTLAQSHAIGRFLAARHGLVPDGGPVKVALADAVEESIRSMFEEMLGMFFSGHDEAGLKKAIDELKKDGLVRFIEAQTKLLKANGSNGFYFDSKLTYVELSLYTVILVANGVIGKGTISTANAPELMRVYDMVKAQPRLVEYWQSERFHKKFFMSLDF